MDTWACVVWVLSSHGNGVCVGWVLISNEDMGVCWVGADQQRRHGCVWGGHFCSMGDMGVCCASMKT